MENKSYPSFLPSDKQACVDVGCPWLLLSIEELQRLQRSGTTVQHIDIYCRLQNDIHAYIRAFASTIEPGSDKSQTTILYLNAPMTCALRVHELEQLGRLPGDLDMSPGILYRPELQQGF